MIYIDPDNGLHRIISTGRGYFLKIIVSGVKP